jgi:hypothetical protein
MNRRNLQQRRFPERMVKPRSAFYNALMLVLLLALTIGCGGKPATPPPGAGEETPPTDVELGDASTSPPSETSPSQGTSQPTPSSPADESGTK